MRWTRRGRVAAGTGESWKRVLEWLAESIAP